jgi:mono/diheme cytochrome c family protein
MLFTELHALSRSHAPALFFSLVAAASALSVAALAQPGEKAAGRRLATELCGDCHQVRPLFPLLHRSPPSFEDIARLPSTTRLSLKVFLQSSHKQMPNFIISKSDTDDIIDYIISLKRQ